VVVFDIPKMTIYNEHSFRSHFPHIFLSNARKRIRNENHSICSREYRKLHLSAKQRSLHLVPRSRRDYEKMIWMERIAENSRFTGRIARRDSNGGRNLILNTEVPANANPFLLSGVISKEQIALKLKDLRDLEIPSGSRCFQYHMITFSI
jgi:hypothetical protein